MTSSGGLIALAFSVTVLAVGAAAAAWAWRRRGRKGGQDPAAAAPARPRAPATVRTPATDAPQPLSVGTAGTTPIDSAVAAAALDPSAPVPASIAELPRVRADSLPAARRDELLAGLRRIPRPPHILQQLASLDFVNRATAEQLETLIQSDPVIAARLLQQLHAASHGRQPVEGGVAQAVARLGLNAVRVICMRQAMTASFRAREPERQRRLDRIWAASAMAGELAQQLGHRVGIPNRDGIAAAVVLSFLGQLAICVSLPLDRLRALPALEPDEDGRLAGRIQRIEAEHRALGIGAGELGRLLMTEWGLPASLVDDAAGLDAVLHDPPRPGDPRDDARALGYAAARLGEALAAGVLVDPAAFDIATAGDDWFRVRQRLGTAPLSALPAALRAPQLGAMLRTAHATPDAP